MGAALFVECRGPEDFGERAMVFRQGHAPDVLKTLRDMELDHPIMRLVEVTPGEAAQGPARKAMLELAATYERLLSSPRARSRSR